jgi:hypothetical protein
MKTTIDAATAEQAATCLFYEFRVDRRGVPM